MTRPHPTAQPARRSWKRLLMPAEHGSWAWLLAPFVTGTLVAGRAPLPAWLVLIGGLSLFLLRQPATVWLRARQGRGRRSDSGPALRAVAVLALLALASLIGLLALGRSAVLWLGVPLAGVLVVYVIVAQRRQVDVRALWMELAGAVGLAVMAPAALVAVSAELTPRAWLLWLLLAAQNALGALFVRVRIADTHGRPAPRTATWAAHVAGLLLVVLAAVVTDVPWPAVVPFVGYAARATWLVPRPRPIPNVKRFGFTEMGVEFAAGVVMAMGYWWG